LQIAPTLWKGVVDALFPVFRVRRKRRLFRLSAGDRLADQAIGQNLPALRAQPLPERGPLPDHSPRSEVRTDACIGHIDEWHLDYPNPIPHIAFGVAPGFSEIAIVFGSAFSETRFIPIGSVSNAMDRDGVKQPVVKGVAKR
jgi:hypothetical protein